MMVRDDNKMWLIGYRYLLVCREGKVRPIYIKNGTQASIVRKKYKGLTFHIVPITYTDKKVGV